MVKISWLFVHLWCWWLRPVLKMTYPSNSTIKCISVNRRQKIAVPAVKPQTCQRKVKNKHAAYIPRDIMLKIHTEAIPRAVIDKRVLKRWCDIVRIHQVPTRILNSPLPDLTDQDGQAKINTCSKVLSSEFCSRSVAPFICKKVKKF